MFETQAVQYTNELYEKKGLYCMEIAKVMKVFTHVEYFFESSNVYVQAD